MNKLAVFVTVLLLALAPAAPHAQSLSTEVAELRQLLAEMRDDYEARIAALEQRLVQAERLASSADRSADDAVEIAEQAAIGLSAGASAANTFNPALGAVLITRYGDIDAGWESIPGFLPGGELGPGGSGVSLGESEINLKSSIDSHFFGNLTLALEDEDGETGLALEEAWVQTTALTNGLTLLAGRYFSAAGYLNGLHRHADDFADRPLPYQAFYGGQFIPDGVQARWITPAPFYLELGGELNWGSSFPASGRGKSSPDAWTVFARTGGDVGLGNSWQAGLSYLAADVLARGGTDDSIGFTGDSDLAVLDVVWKWAPGGNPALRSVKLQGEAFWRNEDGNFDGVAYDGDQDGWYLQGVWQFSRGWRMGYRHDRVSSNNGQIFAGTLLADPGFDPRRDSLMFDFSPSEFSRLRFQYTRDRALGSAEDQWLVQYLMSLGAHGAHQF